MRGTTSGIKPENSFSALSPLSPTVGCFAPHSHPSPPEKKAASRKKSRLRRKKTAPIANSGASSVSRVAYPTCGFSPQPTLRGSSLWLRYLQAALQASPFACMELSTICHLRWLFRFGFGGGGWGKRWRGMRVFGVLISRHGIGWLGFRYFTICFLPWKM